jgi:hypothetical protein
MYAMTISAITAATTIPAKPHSHPSQDDDALSNWASLAFIVPFGRRHAGKEFRGFWMGLSLGTIMFALLIGIHFPNEDGNSNCSGSLASFSVS